MAQPPSPNATKHSPSQVASQARDEGCRAATAAAASAVTPMATCPQPGTAVKALARSIVSRMKRRFSMARSCSGRGADMGDNLPAAVVIDKYFVMQSDSRA